MRTRLLAVLAVLSALTFAAPVAAGSLGHTVDHHCKGCPTSIPKG